MDAIKYSGSFSVILVATLVFCVFFGVTGCQPKVKVPRTFICHQTTGRIKIDGLLNEADWKNAETISFYHLIKGGPQDYREAESQAFGRLLWDKDYLYVSFEAFDKDIWGYYTERDEDTTKEDVLEIFLKPNAQTESYYNFEINALGTVHDAFNFKRDFAGGSHRWRKWDCKGLRIKTKITGSLNNHKDEDEYWQLEVAIPFSAFTEATLAPELGDKWGFALCRYDYSVYLEEGVEYSSTTKFSKVDFHLWKDYDELLFQE